jgi:tetratricopeptide (TPR) repeat protein
MAADVIFDVFLSHASPDKAAVEELARRLKVEKLNPFLDKWHLVPGEPWQETLEEALNQSQTFALFFGPSGLRPWHNEEMRTALATRARDKARRVIPVLLPGASMPAEQTFPSFIERLTWVDFRSGLDDAEAFRRLVCGIKGIPPGDGEVAIAPPPARPTLIGVPHRNPFFTGRETVLSQLHEQLQIQGLSALTQAAIHGLGGIGKTQIAIEYAHRFGAHYRFVLWAVAESAATLHTAYRFIARELGLVDARAELGSELPAVNRWLSSENGWLLVFDNADDPALVRPFLPSTRMSGRVLLTSRARSFISVGIKKALSVETLEPEDAVRFLIERTGDSDIQAAAALAAELGCLPLALEQAAAYIESVGAGCTQYLARYHLQGVALLTKSRPSTDYPKTVATTWSLSFDAVRNASPASAELLTAAAFLAPDSVPLEIFTKGGSEFDNLLADALKGAVEDPLVFWELLEPLERYSLVERLPDQAFKLHRLTQEVVKDSLREEDRWAWVNRVVRGLFAAYPEVTFETWTFCERLQPSAKLAYDLMHDCRLESIAGSRLFLRAAMFASDRGDPAAAKRFAEFSLQGYEHLLGDEHTTTLTARNNLAIYLHELGELASARQLTERILEIRERVLGHDHADTLTTRNTLAETLRSQGDVSGAKRLHEKNLAIMERVLGSEHRNTLGAMNNLAETLRTLDDLAGAMPLQEKSLAMSERLLGAEHPDTVMSRNNLALILRSFADLAGAKRLYEQNLEICERVLGAEHPQTTISTWNLLELVSRLNDTEAKTRLLDKLRWLLDCDEHSISSAYQRTIRRYLLHLLNPS